MNHARLLLADAFTADWPAILDGRKIDLLMLDPPYNKTHLGFDVSFDLRNLCRLLDRHLAATAWLFLWAPMDLAAELVPDYRYKFEYVYLKENVIPKTHNTVRPYYKHELCYAFIRRDLKLMRDLYFDKEAMRVPGKPYKQRAGRRELSEFMVQGRGQSALVTAKQNYGYRENTTILRPEPRRHAKTNHPTSKPVSVLETILRGYCPPGGLVCDPTSGGGSTLLAALNTGRDCICIEKDRRYLHGAVAALRNPLIPEPVIQPPPARANLMYYS